MIVIEKERFDTDKWCSVCNKPDITCKSIKISVKDNNTCFQSVTLCKKCRLNLLSLLAKDLSKEEE